MMSKLPFRVLKYEDMEWIDILEAFLRRSMIVDRSFLLKGSLLTRQYFSNLKLREVGDIDFWYIEKIPDREKAYKIFTDWIVQVTEMDLNDGVKFRSFREHPYWRDVDYFMPEEYPTVNTDITYGSVDEDEDEFEEFLMVDVTFNLELDVLPVPLKYRTTQGDHIDLPYTPSLSTQVAWKLHQTIVRPRFKDLYDLKYLLSHPSYDERARKETLQILLNECSVDQSITKEDIKKVLVDDLRNLYPRVSDDYELKKWAGIKEYWRWRENKEDEDLKKDYFMQCVMDLRQVMDKVGIDENAFQHLSNPMR